MNWLSLNNLSVKLKIYGVTGLLIGALVLTSAYGLSSMNSIGDELVAIAEEDIPLTKIVTEITVHQLEQAINFERALRYGEEIGKEPTAEKHYKESIQHFKKLSRQVDEEIIKGEKLAEEAMSLAHTNADYNEFKHIDEVLKKVEHEHKEYAQHAEAVFVLVEQHKMHDAFVAAEKIVKEEENIDHELKSLLIEIENFTEEAALNAEHHEQAAFRNLIIITTIASLLSIGLAFVVIRGICSGMMLAVNSAAQIANGDLTQEVPQRGQDEIGHLLSALSTMRNKLHTMITEMNHASTELAATSEELAAVTDESNRGIHKQQSEVQQAATAMNEMAATVHEVAQNAQQTAESAHNADNEAHQGQAVVKETVDSIQSLANVIDNASTVIQQVGEDSDNIGSVLDVIKGIAEQTNLLALNAAIEAARAGEQGRGFAVVADEVRTLAQRTQESTSEIEDMISRLQSSSKNAVTAMAQGRSEVSSSVEQAGKAGASLTAITEIVDKINDMNTHIASAAEEQSSVAEELNRNFTSISEVSDMNASAVNQISASSEELSRMATSLQQMVARFEI